MRLEFDWSKRQVNQIAASIREFGFTNPILTYADGSIIAGHGRLLAAKALGLTEVPTTRSPLAPAGIWKSGGSEIPQKSHEAIW